MPWPGLWQAACKRQDLLNSGKGAERRRGVLSAIYPPVQSLGSIASTLATSLAATRTVRSEVGDLAARVASLEGRGDSTEDLREEMIALEARMTDRLQQASNIHVSASQSDPRSTTAP